MKTSGFFFRYIFFLAIIFGWIIGGTGCANIIPPGGGAIDSIPPMLVDALPKDSATNVSPAKVTLYFNEFIELTNANENVIVSPTPKNNPNIDYKLRTITIKFRDALEPNTTYSINFGNAIKDINEGNVLRDFNYVFSTGSTIDNNSLSGKVVVAETGKIDTTLLVGLYKNLGDSAVAKEKPMYITRQDGQGNFIFNNLPAGRFNIFAIPNEFSRKYDDTTKLFAFSDTLLNIGSENKAVILYAFNQAKEEKSVVSPTKPTATVSATDKPLKYSTNLEGNRLDVLKKLELSFNRPLKKFDSAGIKLTNKDFLPVGKIAISSDTSATMVSIAYNWQLNTSLNLLIDKNAFLDSAGKGFEKNDTLKFFTKGEEDYGSVKLRFNNLDTSLNPVLLLIQNGKIVESIPLRQRDWYRKLYTPGEYDLRILFDRNKNGKWDTGNYFGKKRQPETVRDLKIKLQVRGNWDNEKEINF